jgi:hypothetical protein
MRLGEFHVLVTLTHADDGTATFLAHCPRTLREASAVVPPNDETLASLIAEHGNRIIYHADTHLQLLEDASRRLTLTWIPYVRWLTRAWLLPLKASFSGFPSFMRLLPACLPACIRAYVHALL